MTTNREVVSPRDVWPRDRPRHEARTKMARGRAPMSTNRKTVTEEHLQSKHKQNVKGGRGVVCF